jgi:DNA-binding NtrC family response regulator
LIAVTDDDESFLALMQAMLPEYGFRCVACRSGQECLQALASEVVHAVLLDLSMPQMDGMEILKAIHERYPILPVVMLTADNRVEQIVDCIRMGAFDYFGKPPDPVRLTATLRNAVDRYQLATQMVTLSREAADQSYEGLVGKSPAMRRLFRMMDRVAATDINLLIHGESGTGKELVARAVHLRGSRRAGPFIAMSAAALPETLFEAEIFGFERGSFTGANARRIGKLEEADRGTLFLDEVAEIPLSMQAKLLRVMQDRQFQRLGGTALIQSDFRLIAASHRNLAEEVRAGRFREDLYFRIAAFELEIPPLRDRSSDIPLLATHFLRQNRQEHAGRPRIISSAAMTLLEAHSWPGNVRELENVVQRSAILSERGIVEPQHLPAQLRSRWNGASADVEAADVDARRINAPRSLDEIERQTLSQALIAAGGNVSEAMRTLKMGRNRMYRKLHDYGLMSLINELREPPSTSED